MSGTIKGKFRGYAISAEFSKSSKGNDYVRVEFEITEDPHKGERVRWDGYFTEATQARTVESLIAAGCTFPDGNVTDLAGLGSTEVQLVIEPETYNGKTFPKVQWVNKIGGPAVKSVMDGTQRSSFAARLRGLVLKKKGEAGAAPAAAQPAPAAANTQGNAPVVQATGTDDDIPF